MFRLLIVVMVFSLTLQHTTAAELRVPQEYKTIQAGIDAAKRGDTVLVAAGTYRERIRLKAGVRLRSSGDNAKGTAGLKRAEQTILDGGGAGKAPGVVMAEESAIDGFTITNVGVYDDKVWKQHFDSKGEELGDEEGAVQAEGTIPAVSIQSVSCVVSNCLVHHNGDVGIGISGQAKNQDIRILANFVSRNMGGGIGVADGAEPVIRDNTCWENLRAGIGCRKANPIIANNTCYQNVRAGIGCREGSQPVIRGNKCYRNRRAGIGIRMKDTAPVVEENECYENEMAGIGCRDLAAPILRKNSCYKNKLAGIGCRDGAKPMIMENVCRENEAAGIGLQKNANATIQGNKCLDNKLVAIGVTEESSATITENELSRTGGMPPLIAVKDGSVATIRDNQIKGGGVAAILVQGKATISGNTFTGIGDKQGTAIWIWESSTSTVADNVFDGYRVAVSASKATVVVTGNTVRKFQGTAIRIQDSPKPAHVHGNTAISTDATAKVLELTGKTGIVSDNVLKKE